MLCVFQTGDWWSIEWYNQEPPKTALPSARHTTRGCKGSLKTGAVARGAIWHVRFVGMLMAEDRGTTWALGRIWKHAKKTGFRINNHPPWPHLPLCCILLVGNTQPYSAKICQDTVCVGCPRTARSGEVSTQGLKWEASSKTFDRFESGRKSPLQAHRSRRADKKYP